VRFPQCIRILPRNMNLSIKNCVAGLGAGLLLCALVIQLALVVFGPGSEVEAAGGSKTGIDFSIPLPRFNVFSGSNARGGGRDSGNNNRRKRNNDRSRNDDDGDDDGDDNGDDDYDDRRPSNKRNNNKSNRDNNKRKRGKKSNDDDYDDDDDDDGRKGKGRNDKGKSNKRSNNGDNGRSAPNKVIVQIGSIEGKDALKGLGKEIGSI